MGKWSMIINITAVTSVQQINRADNSTFKEDGRGFVMILLPPGSPAFSLLTTQNRGRYEQKKPIGDTTHSH